MIVQLPDLTVDRGQPYELFEFYIPGTSVTWRYTNREHAITVISSTYLPIAIKRGEIERQAGSLGGGCTVTLPDDAEIVSAIFQGSSISPVGLIISQYHTGFADPTTHAIFRGDVSGVSYSGGTATITCGPRFALASRRKVVWLTYQAACNWALGEAECGVDLNSFKHREALAVSSQAGRVLTFASLPAVADAYYNGGYVLRVSTGEKRFVELHEGGDVTLQYPFFGLTSSSENFDIFPGCNNTEEDCQNRFNNLANYLGWARLPTLNPFNRSAYYLGAGADTVAPPDQYDIGGGYHMEIGDQAITATVFQPPALRLTIMAHMPGGPFGLIQAGSLSVMCGQFESNVEYQNAYLAEWFNPAWINPEEIRVMYGYGPAEFITNIGNGWVMPKPLNPAYMPDIEFQASELEIKIGGVVQSLSGVRVGPFPLNTWTKPGTYIQASVSHALTTHFDATVPWMFYVNLSDMFPGADVQVKVKIQIRTPSDGLVRAAGVITTTVLQVPDPNTVYSL